jgi:hypothetical protein
VWNVGPAWVDLYGTVEEDPYEGFSDCFGNHPARLIGFRHMVQMLRGCFIMVRNCSLEMVLVLLGDESDDPRSVGNGAEIVCQRVPGNFFGIPLLEMAEKYRV